MGGANSFTLSYGYYPNGSRQTLSLSCLPNGSNTFTSTYNGRGEWTGLSNPYGETASWSYFDNGWLQTQTLGNGATSTNSYNALGQLLDLSNKKAGGTVLSDYTMTGAGHYDGAGNLLSLTASLPGAPASYSGTTTLQYDGKDQLNREQSGRLGSYTNAFGFDNAGNPTTWKGATQTFNSANQNNAFTYDGDGNPKSWQSNALTFDAGSHLTAIGTTLTAGYNAEGLRAWKQSASGTTYFLYDGLTPIVELDQNANVKAVNSWGANGLLSRRTISTNSSVFYTFDMQGSAAQRLDSSGNILGSYGFDAFGTRSGNSCKAGSCLGPTRPVTGPFAATEVLATGRLPLSGTQSGHGSLHASPRSQCGSCGGPGRRYAQKRRRQGYRKPCNALRRSWHKVKLNPRD